MSIKNYGKGTSVVRDWVTELSWKLQTGLISSIRGFDAPDSDIGTELMNDCKSITRMLRYIILNDADDKTNFMSDRVVFVSKVVDTLEAIKSMEKHNHWYDHIILAMKTIGRSNPSDYVRHYYRQILSMLGEIAEYDIAIPISNKSVKYDTECVAEEDLLKHREELININSEYPNTVTAPSPTAEAEWKPMVDESIISDDVKAKVELKDDVGEMYRNEMKIAPLPTVEEWVDPLVESIINDRYSEEDNCDATDPDSKDWRDLIPEHKLDIRNNTSSILTIIDFVKSLNFKDIRIDSISPGIDASLFPAEDRHFKVDRIVVERNGDNKILWMSNEVFKRSDSVAELIYAIDEECGTMFNSNGVLLEHIAKPDNWLEKKIKEINSTDDTNLSDYTNVWTDIIPPYRVEKMANSSSINDIENVIDRFGIDTINIRPLSNYEDSKRFLDTDKSIAEYKIAIRSNDLIDIEGRKAILWVSDEVYANINELDGSIKKIINGYTRRLSGRCLPERSSHRDIGMATKRPTKIKG